MKIIILSLMMGSAGATTFSTIINGCSVESYRKGLDQVEEEERRLGVWNYCDPRGRPFGYIRRSEIVFKEIGDLGCKLKVKTSFSCVGMDW